MGAVLASREVGNAFKPGEHGTTFGGGPLACAAAKASIQVILDEDLLRKSRENGEYFKSKLNILKEDHGIVEDVRGIGLMLGMEVDVNCPEIVNDMREKHILINCTADKVLRFLPALVIDKDQIDIVTCNLDDILQKYS